MEVVPSRKQSLAENTSYITTSGLTLAYRMAFFLCLTIGLECFLKQKKNAH